MHKTEHPSRRQPLVWAYALLTFTLLMMLGTLNHANAQSQWAPNGNNIYNTNTGNVGIGTTSPQAPLHLSKPFSLNYGQFILQDPSADGAAATVYMSFFDMNSRAGTMGFGRYAGPSDPEFYLVNEQAGGGFRFRNASSDLFTVTNSGNVGIGVTSPALPLEIRGNSGLFNDGRALIGNYDLTPAAQGVGGGIQFGGKFRSDGTVAGFASLSGIKENALDNNFASALVFTTRSHTSQQTEKMRISSTGNVGIGTTNPIAKLDVNGDTNVTGNINATGTINAKYQDVAEWVQAGAAIPAGTVVVLNSQVANQVIASSQSYDTRVAGVVSARPGIALGEAGPNKVLVATTGRVKVKVDATRAPIRIGDLLVTSDVAGVAMKSEPLAIGGRQFHAPGTLIGKALEPLEQGVGEILVLLSLQ